MDCYLSFFCTIETELWPLITVRFSISFNIWNTNLLNMTKFLMCVDIHNTKMEFIESLLSWNKKRSYPFLNIEYNRCRNAESSKSSNSLILPTIHSSTNRHSNGGLLAGQYQSALICLLVIVADLLSPRFLKTIKGIL